MIGASIGTGSFSTGTTVYTYPAALGYRTDHAVFQINITPTYARFINHQTAIGISLLINSSYQKISNKSLSDTIFSSNKSQTSDLGLGAWVRNYFTTGQNWNPFIQLLVNGGSGSGKNDGFTYASDNYGSYKDVFNGKTSGRIFFNAGINLGLTKQLGKHVGLDLFAGYLFSYFKNKNETTLTRDYVAAAGPDELKKFEPHQKFTGNGVSAGAGLQFFLDKKK